MPRIRWEHKKRWWHPQSPRLHESWSSVTLSSFQATIKKIGIDLRFQFPGERSKRTTWGSRVPLELEDTLRITNWRAERPRELPDTLQIAINSFLYIFYFFLIRFHSKRLTLLKLPPDFSCNICNNICTRGITGESMIIFYKGIKYSFELDLMLPSNLYLFLLLVFIIYLLLCLSIQKFLSSALS